MAILTSDELSSYAPSLVGNANADQLILVAQAFVESPQGANRKLELTEYQEIKRINQFKKNVFCSYLPIASDPALVLEVRYNNQPTLFGRQSSVTDWQTVTDDKYIIDKHGKINFRSVLNYGYYAFPNEAQMTYTAGFDFTSDDAEVITIKTLLGQILEYQQKDIYKGRQSLSISGEASVANAFFTGLKQPYQIPDSLILPFKKYRPVGL